MEALEALERKRMDCHRDKMSSNSHTQFTPGRRMRLAWAVTSRGRRTWNPGVPLETDLCISIKWCRPPFSGCGSTREDKLTLTASILMPEIKQGQLTPQIQHALAPQKPWQWLQARSYAASSPVHGLAFLSFSAIS